MQKPGTGYVNFNVNTDQRHRLTGGFNTDYSWNSRGGWGSNQNFFAQYRPSTRLSMSLGLSYSASHSLLQYVAAIKDATATAFYGTRYVVAGINQKSLGLDTRLSVTFSPTMTLELYAQPFVAAGQYFDYKEFDKPREGSYSIYGKDKGTVTVTRDATGQPTNYLIDPDGAGATAPFNLGNSDFNFRSLRGNLVYRWEYRPGSTLYFAWTHSRSDTQPYGDFNLSRDEGGMLATRPDNIFLIKASWWLAR